LVECCDNHICGGWPGDQFDLPLNAGFDFHRADGIVESDAIPSVLRRCLEILDRIIACGAALSLSSLSRELRLKPNTFLPPPPLGWIKP